MDCCNINSQKSNKNKTKTIIKLLYYSSHRFVRIFFLWFSHLYITVFVTINDSIVLRRTFHLTSDLGVTTTNLSTWQPTSHWLLLLVNRLWATTWSDTAQRLVSFKFQRRVFLTCRACQIRDKRLNLGRLRCQTQPFTLALTIHRHTRILNNTKSWKYKMCIYTCVFISFYSLCVR